MKTFYVGIKGVIINSGKVLVLKGASGRDFWEVPGGRIDGDETIEQALRRELREEVPNIKAIVMHEVVDAYRVPKDIDGDKSLVLVFYLVTADFDGKPKTSDEHSAAKWVSEEEALELVHESCRTAISNAFERLA